MKGSIAVVLVLLITLVILNVVWGKPEPVQEPVIVESAPVVMYPSDIDNLTDKQKEELDQKYEEFRGVQSYEDKKVYDAKSEEDYLYAVEYADARGINWLEVEFDHDYATYEPEEGAGNIVLDQIYAEYPDWEPGKVCILKTTSGDYLVCENKDKDPYLVKYEDEY